MTDTTKPTRQELEEFVSYIADFIGSDNNDHIQKVAQELLDRIQATS